MVDMAGLMAPPDGWHHRDDVTQLRLQASVRRYGQLRPLLVRTAADGARMVVDGRELLVALRAVGMASAWVVDVGPVSDTEARRLMLALELSFDVDYARLAAAVAAMLRDGLTPDELASAGPWTAERLSYMDTLTRFDWSVFAARGDGQSAMDWDEAPDAEPPVAEQPPSPETMAEVEHALEHAAPGEVVAAVRAVAARRRRRERAEAPSLFDGMGEP